MICSLFTLVPIIVSIKQAYFMEKIQYWPELYVNFNSNNNYDDALQSQQQSLIQDELLLFWFKARRRRTTRSRWRGRSGGAASAPARSQAILDIAQSRVISKQWIFQMR